MNLKRVVISGTSLAAVGMVLVGCSKKSVKDGTEYIHTYTDVEEEYCFGSNNIGTSTRIEGKTGKIKIYTSGMKARIEKLCYGSYLYPNGEAKVEECGDNKIKLKFNLKANERTIASSVTTELPKTDKYISIPIDLEQEVYVKFNKDTK